MKIVKSFLNMNVASHSTWRVRREEPYMEGFHNTPSRPFLEGRGPIKKKTGATIGPCVRHNNPKLGNIR